MSQETVLITGASSGIGWELAKQFAADGSKLILVARREEKLKELADELDQSHGTECVIIPMDLVEENASQRLHQSIIDGGHTIDVLVNNAGFGQFGLFDKIPIERHRSMIQLNIAVLTELTYCFLPMLEERKGSVLNIGSTASFQPGPNSAVYYATKAFVLSFSEAIFAELQSRGVSVTCLCPGPTRTGFGADSDMENTPVFKYNSMRVEDVARAGHRGVRKRKRLVMPGLVNNLMAWSVRLTPRSTLLKVMQLLQPVQ